MKTPRDCLLGKYDQADPKLAAAQQRALAALPANRPPKTSNALGGLALLWARLIAPCPSVWGGLGVVWLVILGLNLSSVSDAPRRAVPRPPPETRAQIQWQRAWLTELSTTGGDAAAPPSKTRPRSQLSSTTETA
jgi:uncharacterized protein YecT (DUF1311 family)